MLTPEDLASLGLYDPNSKHAQQQLELLQLLLDLGATREDLLEFRNELSGLASVLLLRPGSERLTVHEAAEAVGQPVEDLLRLIRAAGLVEPPSDERSFSEADVEVFRNFRAGEEVFGRDAMLQLVRVIGSSLARIADAGVTTFLVNVEAPIAGEDPVGLGVARANVRGASLMPMLAQAMDVLLRRHLLAARRPYRALEQFEGYEVQRLAVGFVDVIGSTRVAQELSVGEFGSALGEFERNTADTVNARGRRMVKLIGDEIMFVAPDPAAACAIALHVAKEFSSHPVLPGVRAGVAYGEVVSREGDFFGPVVNLAARIVKLGDSGAVVTSDDLRAAVKNGYRFTSLGAQELKGFSDPVVVHRVEDAG